MYVAGFLEAPEASGIRRDLAECDPCKREVEVIARLPTEPAGLTSRLLPSDAPARDRQH
jgi:anti-sigma factor RsiW